MDRTETKIRPVILAGGNGTRLWPKSRAAFPKQFTNLLGDESLFQRAVRRVTGADLSPPIIVTAEPFRFIVLEQLDQIGVGASAVLIEPEAKNTGPAIAAALAWMQANDPASTVLVAPSDHIIEDKEVFQATVKAAADYGGFITFGITPDRPETGYGWLEISDAPPGSGAVPVRRFVEKPDATIAQSMLEQGNFLWNAGIFLAPFLDFQEAYHKHAPSLLSCASEALAKAKTELGFTRLDTEAWAAMNAISVDYAVMEHLSELCVIPWTKAWSDLGSWDAVKREMGNGTISDGSAIAIDCEETLLSSPDGQPLVGVGLKDIIAVALPDAVLVTNRNAVQNVGRAVEILASHGIAQASEFPRDHRPWGWFETLAVDDRFRVKRIVVKPGARLSLQSHQRRAEHWVVVEGTAQVTIGETKRRVGENQSIYVPVGARHRLENADKSNLVLIEVQTGAYLDEDDIERFEDDYLRD